MRGIRRRRRVFLRVRLLNSGRCLEKLKMFAVFEFFLAFFAVFFFGAFPFQELFFGHLVIVAGGEHGTALAALRRA